MRTATSPSSVSAPGGSGGSGGRGDAVAKAKLLSDLLRRAALARVRPTAQALLAILIAESWWSRDDEAWAVRMTRHQLATRLGVENVVTVDRAREELVRANLICHERGGHTDPMGAGFAAPSRFILDPPTSSITPAPPAPPRPTRPHLSRPADVAAGPRDASMRPSPRPPRSAGPTPPRRVAQHHDAPLLWPDMDHDAAANRAEPHPRTERPSTPAARPVPRQAQIADAPRRAGASPHPPEFGFQQGCASATPPVAPAQPPRCASATPLNVFQSPTASPPPPDPGPPHHGVGGGGGGEGNSGGNAESAGGVALLAAGVLSAKVRAELGHLAPEVIRHAMAMHANAPPDKRVGRVVMALRDGTAAAALIQIAARRATRQPRPPPETPPLPPAPAVVTPAQKRAIRARILAAESETRR